MTTQQNLFERARNIEKSLDMTPGSLPIVNALQNPGYNLSRLQFIEIMKATNAMCNIRFKQIESTIKLFYIDINTAFNKGEIK
jgi:hypothetical protein